LKCPPSRGTSAAAARANRLHSSQRIVLETTTEISTSEYISIRSPPLYQAIRSLAALPDMKTASTVLFPRTFKIRSTAESAMLARMSLGLHFIGRYWRHAPKSSQIRL
jgi:hypothetical protein